MEEGRNITASGAPSVLEVFEGLAQFAGALVELPAVRAASLRAEERTEITARLADGWNLAAFTPTGLALLRVMELGGAVVELTNVALPAPRTAAGSPFPRATSHGTTVAAWGAPPGRRIAAMGLAPGPRGTVVRLSCALVLRLPVTAVVDPVSVATTVSWHAALHASERAGLPADGALLAALEDVDALVGLHRSPRGRVEWARGVVDRVRAELGIPDVAVPVA